MGGLCHAVVGSHAEPRGHAEAADELRRLVGGDVAEHVGGDHHVIVLGLHQHLHGEGVDDDRLERDVRIVPGHLTAGVEEKPAPELEDGVLVDGGQHEPFADVFDVEGRLKVFDVLAQRGLGEVEGLCGLGEVLVLLDCENVTQFFRCQATAS